ncbi:MAG: PadR family transcriptional regulator [Desulfurococcales archaeon]|nr:PadR family transcriptional regulator [Desulfurococcales archaeon]
MEAKPLKRLEKKLTVEVLWLYIIAVLLEKPTYGYDVRRRIRERFGFKPATVTTYTVIYRLEREGLIEKKSDGTYTVTEEGEMIFQEGVEMLGRVYQLLSSQASNVQKG